ncbi:MAG: LamG domain-containing protein [Pirellulales bacterium]|nr:LamG domain-containing protein [Pirellulales bacterium]
MVAPQLIDITADCYTLTGWFKTTASSSSGPGGASTGGRDYFSLYLNGNFGAYIQHAPSGSNGTPPEGPWRYLHRMPMGTGGPDNVYARTVINDGVWHHFAAVREGTTMTMYLDGSMTETREFAGQDNFEVALQLCFGRNQASNPVRHWFGSLDDARIYGRALLPEEVSELANE